MEIEKSEIKFSICICNRDMSDTLQKNLESILNQISKDYEVIVVDDGSTDESLKILNSLSLKHNNLRVIPLVKDKNRRLGFTRNISISLANGEWCIFHLDTDDLIGPYIHDFEKLVLLLDSRLKKDFLYSGQHIHMARKDFLIKNGPFKNIYRGEDRDLFQRLAFKNQWLVIEHRRFISRMPRERKKYFKKIFLDAWDATVTDLQMRPKPLRYAWESTLRIRSIGTLRFFHRIFIIPLALVAAFKRGIYDTDDRINNSEEFSNYRKENTKNFSDWVNFLSIDKKLIKGINQEIFY
jgi:glycosyltransferase involved in cell wall biosynthesis